MSNPEKFETDPEIWEEIEEEIAVAEEMDKRIEALAKHLECDSADIEPTSLEFTYEFGCKEYLVLTDQESTKRIAEEIRDSSLCYFEPWFLSKYTGLSEKIITLLQYHEDSVDLRDALMELIGDKFDDLVEDAMDTDGRGHFLSSYDGSEEVVVLDKVSYFIYRL